MRRTRMMLAAAVVALATSGTGVALAQSNEDPALREQCASYSFFEWLFFGHECHGHTAPYIVYPWGR